MRIPLNSAEYVVVEIKAKTRAEMFAGIEVGDRLMFTMNMKHTGQASGGGAYASVVHSKNVTKGTTTAKSQSETINIVERCFVLKEVGE